MLRYLFIRTGANSLYSRLGKSTISRRQNDFPSFEWIAQHNSPLTDVNQYCTLFLTLLSLEIRIHASSLIVYVGFDVQIFFRNLCMVSSTVYWHVVRLYFSHTKLIKCHFFLVFLMLIFLCFTFISFLFQDCFGVFSFLSSLGELIKDIFAPFPLN